MAATPSDRATPDRAKRRDRRPAPARAARGIAGRSSITLIAMVVVMRRSSHRSLTGGPRLAQDTGADRAAQRAAPAVRPGDVLYEGEDCDVYYVPIRRHDRELALVKKGRAAERRSSTRRNPDAGRSRGKARGGRSSQPWKLAPPWSNYADVWNLIDFPRLLFNTIVLALIGTIGTRAVVHARGVRIRAVPVPGPRRCCSRCCIATIFLPEAVTLIPTYTMFVKLGWVGTWLPLLVPAFFANAYDVFLSGSTS